MPYGWNWCSLKPVNEGDLKGQNTWEWKFDDGRQITVYRRPAGFVTGHMHSGIDQSKNPERLLLISGKARIAFYHPDQEDKCVLENICSAIRGPQEITIQPGTSHRFEAITDVIYIEYRITHFDPKNPDTSPMQLP